MMKNKLTVIGEALIDFIPLEKGRKLKDVSGFLKMPGGSVANVAAAYKACGYDSKILTQLGNDAFGNFLIDCMNEAHIDTSYIRQSDEYDTSLAFVSLDENGNRDFKFYRKTAADLHYREEMIPTDILDDGSFIHFCSVDLVDSEMKQAHKKLIQMAKKQNVYVSFDPNLRFSLWPSEKQLYETVHEFLPYADIIKISDEEIDFLSQGKHESFIQECLKTCQILLITKGASGAELYTNDQHLHVNGLIVDVKDTTGAGDAFIGFFLAKLTEKNQLMSEITQDDMMKILEFANSYAAYTTTKLSGISAMAPAEEIFK